MKKLVCMFAAIYCIFFGLLPFYHGSFQTGAWMLLVFGLAFLLTGFLPKPSSHRTLACRWYRFINVVFSLVVVSGLVISLGMAYAAWLRPPTQTAPSTLVVLGCQASNGRPSLMLRLRINRAAEYLLANSDVNVVATGGYDSPGEIMSEAQVIEQELIARGISVDRIFRDDASRNTKENLLYAADIIYENQLPSRVIIVTDGFHQLRGQLYALRADLQQPSGLPSVTPWGLAPSYWVREWGGLAKMLVEP